MGTTHGAFRSVGSADCYALDLGFVCFGKRDYRNTFFEGCRYYGSVYGNWELKRRCKVSVWRLCYDGLDIHDGFRLVSMDTNCSTLNITTHILFGHPLEVNGDAVGTVSFANIDRHAWMSSHRAPERSAGLCIQITLSRAGKVFECHWRCAPFPSLGNAGHFCTRHCVCSRLTCLRLPPRHR